jgi:hypothetical protein
VRLAVRFVAFIPIEANEHVDRLELGRRGPQIDTSRALVRSQADGARNLRRDDDRSLEFDRQSLEGAERPTRPIVDKLERVHHN